MTQGYLQLKLAAGLFVGLLLSLSAVPTAHAAERESITLSPVSKHYQLKAGETIVDELTIINDGDTAYEFTVYAQPYSVSSENYDPDFVNDRDNTDAYKWIKAEKSRYRLAAGESIKVKYTITVPSGARPGGHFGAIFAETQPAETAGANSVARKKRVGAIVYATVDGRYRTGGSLRDISIPRLQLKTPLLTETRVENTGNTNFETDLKLTVADLFGNVKYTDTKAYQVLPETTRKMSLVWVQAPTFGLFKVSVSAKFLDENVTKEGYVLLAPLGAQLAVVGVLFAAIVYFVHKRRK